MKAKIKNLKHIGLSALAITCLSTVITTTAQAGVYKTISGVACTPTNGAYSNFDIAPKTGIEANVSFAGDITCPLEIDDPAAGLPVGIYIYYKRPTAVIGAITGSCRVTSTEWDQSPHVSTPIPMPFTGLLGNYGYTYIEVDTMAYGHMVVGCSLYQPGEAIQSINYKIN